MRRCPTIRARVATGTTVYADEAPGWDALHARYDTRRINHSVAFSDDGACTNQAESYFSRLRRAEWGQHHHISGKYLGAYAREMAWREDTRRRPNGTLHGLVAAAALGHPVSRMWKGYWQRGRSSPLCQGSCPAPRDDLSFSEGRDGGMSWPTRRSVVRRC